MGVVAPGEALGTRYSRYSICVGSIGKFGCVQKVEGQVLDERLRTTRRETSVAA